jgi:hypothetical protein
VLLMLASVAYTLALGALGTLTGVRILTLGLAMLLLLWSAQAFFGAAHAAHAA